MGAVVAEVNVHARLTVDTPLTLKSAAAIRRGLIDDVQTALHELHPAAENLEDAEAIADMLIDFRWVTEAPPTDEDDDDV